MTKLKLHTTTAAHNELHALYHSTRPSTLHVKVPRAALINLLMDHSNLVGLVGLDNVVVDGEVQP